MQSHSVLTEIGFFGKICFSVSEQLAFIDSMKQPSDHLRALINQLQQLTYSFYGRGSGATTEEIELGLELLKKISDCGEWTAIPFLMPFLATQADVANATASCVQSLVTGMRPTMLLELDERSRGSSWREPPDLSFWGKFKNYVFTKPTAKENLVGVVGVSTFHRIGYVRESALIELALLRGGGELPFLLIRLNDWVPQVRAIAEKAMEERMQTSYLQSFVDNLALVQRVSQRTRNGLKSQEITGRMTEMLLQEANIHLLFDGLKHHDYEVSRRCLDLLMLSRAGNSTRIIELVVRHKDLKNRLMAFELANTLPADARSAVWLQLAKDRAPSVRRLALGALCENSSAESNTFLQAALLDKGVAVRDFARWKLKDLGIEIDYRQFYIEQLKSDVSPQVLAAAIAGLGEIGQSHDAELIVPFVEHTHNAVKKSAIKSLARLAAHEYQHLFLQLLKNHVASISNAGAAALALTISSVDAGLLWDALVETKSWYVKRSVLRLLNQVNKWDRLTYLMLALSEPDASVQEMALGFVDMWTQEYDTSWRFTEPNEQQLKRLADALPGARARLSSVQISLLQECLALRQKQ